jgi:hypothetical protein
MYSRIGRNTMPCMTIIKAQRILLDMISISSVRFFAAHDFA